MIEIQKYIDIHCKDIYDKNKNCPIVLGGVVVCDGYLEQKRIGVFTHFHQDHIKDIEDCTTEYSVILLHPITHKVITALKPGLKLRQQIKPQDYGTIYQSQNAAIKLLDANHIPGSCQVLVDYADKKLLYSGDFSFPDCQIESCDFLVLDASHGDPSFDSKTDRESVMRRMFEDVKERLDSRKPVRIKSSLGTMQEIIRFFEIGCGDDKISGDIPFIAKKEHKIITLAMYEPEKEQFRDILEKETPDANRIISYKKPAVIFDTQLSSDEYEDEEQMYTIYVDRYRFGNKSAAIEEISRGARYNLAAHASYAEILNYVKATGAKTVITDASRSAYAKTLSNKISQELGVLSYPLPG